MAVYENIFSHGFGQKILTEILEILIKLFAYMKFGYFACELKETGSLGATKNEV